jgi:hypothetical protein
MKPGMRRGGRGALALLAAASVFASAAQASPMARAADTCTLTSPSPAAVENVFGKGEQQAPIAEKEFCYVTGTNASVKIYPYPARQAKRRQAEWLAGIASFGRRVTKSHPPHFGKGATLLRTPRNDEVVLWFTRGGHFVVISTLLGGTPAQVLSFGRLVYAKL